MALDTPLYQLADVIKRFEGRTVLEAPFLEVPPGGIIALQGPNGAGKTTLLRILAFLSIPDSGVLRFMGKAVDRAANHLTALRRRVTLVAQDSYLFNSTVEKNVAYGPALRGAGRDERQAAARRALEMVGLSGYEKRRAHQLSRGESQRTALARALAVQPEVLLLDEPFTALDRDQVPSFEKVIARLPETGCTVIMVTHDQDQADRLAQGVITVRNGRVTQTQG